MKIHKIIPKAYRLDNYTTQNQLKFVLPFSEQNKFASLFLELEKIPDIKVPQFFVEKSLIYSIGEFAVVDFGRSIHKT